MKRERSSSYPSYTLSECLSFTETIYKSFGDASYIKAEDLAIPFKVAYRTLILKISSAVQYGLLELKKTYGYKPSPLFKKIYRPLNDAEKRENLILALQRPTLYQSLIKRYDGDLLPVRVALSNIFVREFSISDSASDKASDVFLKNLQALKLLSEDNHLQINSSSILREEEEEEEEIFEIDTVHPKTPSPNNPVLEDKIEDNNFRRIDIPLLNKKKATLIIPTDITLKDIDIMRAQLQVISLYVESQISEE